MVEHPITPPPELTQEWSCDCPLTDPFSREFYVAIQAARWGADQELEACCKWLVKNDWKAVHQHLRAARRPKPPSKKEALDELCISFDRGYLKKEAADIIRRALESLPE